MKKLNEIILFILMTPVLLGAEGGGALVDEFVKDEGLKHFLQGRMAYNNPSVLVGQGFCRFFADKADQVFGAQQNQVAFIEYLANGEVDVFLPRREHNDQEAREFLARLFFYLGERNYPVAFHYDLEKEFRGLNFRHRIKFNNQGSFLVFARDELGLSEAYLRQISATQNFFATHAAIGDLADFSIEQQAVAAAPLPPAELVQAMQAAEGPLQAEEAEVLEEEYSVFNDVKFLKILLCRQELHGYANKVLYFFDKDQNLYCVWFNLQFSAIIIQKAEDYSNGLALNKIGIQVDVNHQIISIRKNDQEASLEDLDQDLLARALEQVFESVEQYTSRDLHGSKLISINVLAAKLKKEAHVSRHLNKFSEQLLSSFAERNDPPQLNVKFIEENLQLGPGIDASGLTRTYLGSLIEAVLANRHPDILVKKNEKQNIFQIKGDEITVEERGAYEQLGQYFMFLNRANADKICGKHFEVKLFKALLAFRAEELDSEGFLETAKIRVCHILAEGDPQYATMTNFLTKTDAWSIADLDEAKQYADIMFDKEWSFKEGEALRPHIEEMKTELKETIFTKYAQELPALQAISRGMKEFCIGGPLAAGAKNQTWDQNYFGQDGRLVSQRVQGELNKEKILAEMQMEWGGDPNDLRVQWLKDWMRTSSEEKLEVLVKLITGVSAVPEGQRLKVLLKENGAIAFHTCFNRIDLPKDIPSQDLFNFALDTIISEEDQGYNMG